MSLPSSRPPAAEPSPGSAAARAVEQVQAVSEDPAGRLALVARTYGGPSGDASRHLPFRRAAVAFMRWQVDRGVLAPLDAEPPGSPWWRAVNERLVRDGCEAVARSDGLGGRPSSPTIEHWMRFVSRPSASTWYRAHNASIVSAYLEHQDLARAESEAERFFLNVVLLRVLYAHALVAAPRLALGRFAPLGSLLGDPRLGMVSAFLSLGRILPDRYPAPDELRSYIEQEHSLGRLLDYGVIGTRLAPLYEWSADELGTPGLLELIRDGSPMYAWTSTQRWVWYPSQVSPAVRVLRHATRPPRGHRPDRRAVRRAQARPPDAARPGT